MNIINGNIGFDKNNKFVSNQRTDLAALASSLNQKNPRGREKIESASPLTDYFETDRERLLNKTGERIFEIRPQEQAKEAGREFLKYAGNNIAAKFGLTGSSFLGLNASAGNQERQHVDSQTKTTFSFGGGGVKFSGKASDAMEWNAGVTKDGQLFCGAEWNISNRNTDINASIGMQTGGGDETRFNTGVKWFFS